MIHAKNTVICLPRPSMEQGICRNRAKSPDAGCLQPGNRRRDHLIILVAELAVFPSMGVQAADGDARVGAGEIPPQ